MIEIIYKVIKIESIDVGSNNNIMQLNIYCTFTFRTNTQT